MAEDQLIKLPIQVSDKENIYAVTGRKQDNINNFIFKGDYQEGIKLFGKQAPWKILIFGTIFPNMEYSILSHQEYT